jgi:hypothetical protein
MKKTKKEAEQRNKTRRDFTIQKKPEFMIRLSNEFVDSLREILFDET